MNIKDIREIMGLTQAQVADELGVPRQEVIDCEENGETYLLLQYISAFPINPQILTDPDVDPFLPSFDQGSAGHRLRRWRTENGISLEDMAFSLGISPEELSDMEDSPDLQFSRRRGEEFEKKTGINRKWLMYGDGRVLGSPRIHAAPAPAPRASRAQGEVRPAPNKAAGLRVKEARKAAGLSREELADLLNLSVSRVAQMESGYIRDQKAAHVIHRIDSLSDAEKEEDPKSAGNRVREFRKAAGLSVREAAELVSLKHTTLAHLESGYITPRRADELIARLRAAAAEKGITPFDPRAAGQKIREERLQAGLSQKELGTIMRLPVTRITHIELGQVTEKEYEEILRRIHLKPRREIRVRKVKPADQVLLGSRIRDLREAASMSQKALGDLLGMPQTRISLMERGKVDEPTAKAVIQKLNAILDSRRPDAASAPEAPEAPVPSPAPAEGRRRRNQKPLRPDLGRRIHDARLAAGLSQRQLGALLGLSQGGVSYLEQGKTDEETADRALQAIAEAGGAQQSESAPSAEEKNAP